LACFTLLHAARNAVEHEYFGFRVKPVNPFHALDVILPEINGEFVRHKFAARGIFPELPTYIALQIQRTKHIAAGEMVEAGN